MKIKNYFSLYYIIIIIIIILLLIAILIVVIINKKSTICPLCPLPNEQICRQFIKKSTDLEKESNNLKILSIPTDNIDNDNIDNRDKRVLSDPLFPPLNRTDRNTFNNVVRETKNRNINIPSRDINDSYHLVGYITNKDINGNTDSGNNNWKLMAREKDKNESEFYLIPTNNNYDIKIPITQEIVIGQRIKDIYSIPKNINFNSPLLNKTPYEFVELPKTDFSSFYN